jgi:hypothetical protein
VVLLSAGFPGESEHRLRELVANPIEEAATNEWPAMAAGHATLTLVPCALDADRHRDGPQRQPRRQSDHPDIVATDVADEITVKPTVMLQVMPEAGTGGP